MSQFYKSKAIAGLVNYICTRIRPRNTLIFFTRVNQYSTTMGQHRILSASTVLNAGHVILADEVHATSFRRKKRQGQ